MLPKSIQGWVDWNLFLLFTVDWICWWLGSWQWGNEKNPGCFIHFLPKQLAEWWWGNPEGRGSKLRQLKETRHGDWDAFSWRPLLIIPGDISKRELKIWIIAGNEQEWRDCVLMAFIIMGPGHSPQEGKVERKDKRPRQMAEAGHHLEVTQRRKNC